MNSTLALHIDTLIVEDQFFIYDRSVVEDNDYEKLFLWHEASFYGSFLKMQTVKGVKGVILSPWEALDFFAKDVHNSFIHVDWSEESQLYRKIAPLLKEALTSTDFLPDYHSWKLHQRFRWKLTDVWLSEVKEAVNHNEEHESIAIAWFSSALANWLQSDDELKNVWNDIEQTFPLISLNAHDEHQRLQSSEINPKHDQIHPQTIVFSEDDWLEKIGWKLDTTPFTVGLRLDEPEQDDGIWLLETFLRSKDNKDELMILNEDQLPTKWKPYIDRIEREQTLWGKLIPWLRTDRGIMAKLTEQHAWEFLTEASETLLSAGVEILLPSWWQALKDTNLSMKAKVKSTSSNGRKSFVGLTQLIDFDWRFSTNGIDLSEDEFLTLVDQKRRLVNIRGKWVKLDPEFIRRVQSVLEKANKEGLHFRDILEQELLRDELTDGQSTADDRPFAMIQIELNRHLKNMLKQLNEVQEIPSATIPATFCGELRPYQQQGVDWLLFLRKFGFGACLADDMGLGKTIQMIAYLLKVKEEGKKHKPSLLICPTSVLGNWQKELEKFAPSLRVHLHYGSYRAKGDMFESTVHNADVVITSYGLSHLDFEDLSSIQWGTICIDEAQNIKNADTKQSKAIRQLVGEHHIALTGTPMENRLSELWSIFDFSNPGYLGSLGKFHKDYVNPIEKDRSEQHINKLQKLIRPFLLRRTKTDKEVALNLPDKQEQKEYCPLTVEQASLYEQLVQDTLTKIEQETGIKRKGLILTMLSKLKQLCNHPALYLKEEQPLDVLNRSTKLSKLRELIDNIRESDESCLIFTQYIGMGNMIKKLLEDELGEEILFLNGSLAKTKRDQMITRFQNKEVNIMILSLKAGGTGLNLTAANHVIHFDRWWNPAVENQATDRAHRIGQKRFVHVHKFISTGTLEEKIDQMLEQKQALNDQIIQTEAWITELSTEELQNLLL
ncbi:DEAD/DEAH box helicase [Cytobacillus sp. IB215316]|uniref:DEAD/DEAH box helicase n=1 Tax=Cytobacillus sp. IB215316 TaxID=3097354 RepID=UPI002A10ECD2|nr:DEAD/DEAH box helicase [Cytobacillus sp. IB215316]MDX8361131.1 DEAD/DEAH box helicase [Cytobacillus sp. IB215316]